MKSIFKILIFALIAFSVTTVSAWTLGGNYNKSDSNFNKLAMRVYNSNSSYIFTQGAYTYNAIPITSTASGCKIISIIRQTQSFSNKDIENYKICNSSISDVENTNPAGWNNLPNGIKPLIDSVIAETRQYGKASANYNGYRVIGKKQVYGNAVYVYVLNGIKLEAMMRF